MSKFIDNKDYYICFVSEFALNNLNADRISNTIEYLFIHDMCTLYHSNRRILTQQSMLDSSTILAKYNPSYKEYYQGLLDLECTHPLYTRNFMFMIRLVTKFGYISKNIIINEMSALSQKKQYFLLFNLKIKSLKCISNKRYVKILSMGMTEIEISNLISLINSEIKLKYEHLHRICWASRRINYNSYDCGRVLHAMNQYSTSHKIWDDILHDIRYGFTFICTTSQIRELYRRYQRKKNNVFNINAEEEKNNFNPQNITLDCIVDIICRSTKGVVLSDESVCNLTKLLMNEKIKNERMDISDSNLFFNHEKNIVSNIDFQNDCDKNMPISIEAPGTCNGYTSSGDIKANIINDRFLNENCDYNVDKGDNESEYTNFVEKYLNPSDSNNGITHVYNNDPKDSLFNQPSTILHYNTTTIDKNDDILSSHIIIKRTQNNNIPYHNSLNILNGPEEKLYSKLEKTYGCYDLIYPHILRKRFYSSKNRPILTDLIDILNTLVAKDKLVRRDTNIYSLK